MQCDLDTTIPEWIIEHPETTVVFNQFELDVSCGGKSLGYVCRHQGVNPTDVLLRLHAVIEGKVIKGVAINIEAINNGKRVDGEKN